MYEYVTLRDFIVNLKYFKPQLADHTIDIFYIIDKDGAGVEHLIWHGKLKDCNPNDPLFRNYKYLWYNLALSAQVIDICCKRMEE